MHGKTNEQIFFILNPPMENLTVRSSNRVVLPDSMGFLLETNG